jgi:hypothetical protein
MAANLKNLKVLGNDRDGDVGLALSSSEVEALAGGTGILPAVQVWDRAIPVLMARFLA